MHKTIQFIKSKMPFIPLQVLNITPAKELKQIEKDLKRMTKASASRNNKMGKNKSL